jgi:hypothetical protein
MFVRLVSWIKKIEEKKVKLGKLSDKLGKPPG